MNRVNTACKSSGEAEGIHGVLFSKRGGSVAGMLFVVYLLVYGVYMEGREWYLNVDEMLGYVGSGIAREVYLCNGRWGLALYRYVFAGLAPMNGVLIAGVCVCMALTLQGRLLGLQSFFYCCVYGVIALCVPLLGEHLRFANQSDAVGLGVFLSTLAVWFTVKQKGLVFRLWAVVMLVGAMGMYQSLLLNAVVLYLSVLYMRGVRGEVVELWECVRVMVFVLVSSVILYALLCCVAVRLPWVTSEIRQYVEAYQQSLFPAEAFLSGDFVFLGRLVGHNVIKLFKLMVGLGMPELCYTTVFAALLGMWKVSKKHAGGLRFFMALLPWLILATPFLICVLTNASANAQSTVRTYSAVPFASAVLWSGVLQGYSISKRGRLFIVWLLMIFMLLAAYNNEKKLRSDRIYFSSSIRDYILMEYEAARASTAAGGSAEPRVLLFDGKGNAAFDGKCFHPYVRNIYKPSEKEKLMYTSQVCELPCWPNPGSMRRVDSRTFIVRYR